jgi:hypothetical protein
VTADVGTAAGGAGKMVSDDKTVLRGFAPVMSVAPVMGEFAGVMAEVAPATPADVVGADRVVFDPAVFDALRSWTGGPDTGTTLLWAAVLCASLLLLSTGSRRRLVLAATVWTGVWIIGPGRPALRSLDIDTQTRAWTSTAEGDLRLDGFNPLAHRIIVRDPAHLRALNPRPGAEGLLLRLRPGARVVVSGVDRKPITPRWIDARNPSPTAAVTDPTSDGRR